MSDLPVINSQLPAELVDQMSIDAGLGVSHAAEDRLTPLVFLLQTTSAVCDRRGDAFITDAAPGMYRFRGDREPIRAHFDGIPCGRMNSFLEFTEGQRQLVGRHDRWPSDIENHKTASGRSVWVRAGSGNTVVASKELFLLVEGQARVMPCSSTKLAFLRKLNSHALQFIHPRSKETLPSFSRHYRFSSAPTANVHGSWHTPTFEDMGWTSLSEYQAARELALMVKRGAQRPELPSSDVVDGEPATEPVRVVGMSASTRPGAA